MDTVCIYRWEQENVIYRWEQENVMHLHFSN